MWTTGRYCNHTGRLFSLVLITTRSYNHTGRIFSPGGLYNLARTTAKPYDHAWRIYIDAYPNVKLLPNIQKVPNSIPIHSNGGFTVVDHIGHVVNYCWAWHGPKGITHITHLSFKHQLDQSTFQPARLGYTASIWPTLTQGLSTSSGPPASPRQKSRLATSPKETFARRVPRVAFNR